MACEKGNAELVQLLLKRPETDVNYKSIPKQNIWFLFHS